MKPKSCQSTWNCVRTVSVRGVGQQAPSSECDGGSFAGESCPPPPPSPTPTPTVHPVSVTAALLLLLCSECMRRGAKSIAEVRDGPADVTLSRAPSGSQRRTNHSGFEESPRASPKSRLEISTGEGQVAEWEKWKMDEFQSRPRCFSLSLSSPSQRCSSARKGSQRAQLSIQAKNTAPHALWNTLPLFTCRTPPS